MLQVELPPFKVEKAENRPKKSRRGGRSGQKSHQYYSHYHLVNQQNLIWNNEDHFLVFGRYNMKSPILLEFSTNISYFSNCLRGE